MGLASAGVLFIEWTVAGSTFEPDEVQSTIPGVEAGWAVIPRGQRRVTVRFPQAYLQTPGVTAASAPPLAWHIGPVTPTEFVLETSRPPQQDIRYFWVAHPSQDAPSGDDRR